MKRKPLFTYAALCSVFLTGYLSFGAADAQVERKLGLIKLPPRFEISVYAEGVPNARQLAVSPNGTVFVGSIDVGKVYAVVDKDKDGRAEEVHQVASRIDTPSGVAFHNGSLYIGALNRVYRLDDIESQLDDPPQPVVVADNFPRDEWHGRRVLEIGRDGKLYMPVGSPCNVCVRDDEIYASIARINLDGSGREIVAHGVRNTVGFDWHPETGDLWFTDNGRDNISPQMSITDNLPGDELNRMTEEGKHFGFPYIHQGDTPDPEFGGDHSPDEFVKPAQVLGAHVAALGMRFYTGKTFPKEYRNQIFIAEHGSWNRRKKSGYRIALVRLEDSKVVSYETFAEGWKQNEEAWGRPNALLVMPDGALLVSDDEAGVIYRIQYTG